jgi:hypothetical protein
MTDLHIEYWFSTGRLHLRSGDADTTLCGLLITYANSSRSKWFTGSGVGQRVCKRCDRLRDRDQLGDLVVEADYVEIAGRPADAPGAGVVTFPT